MFSANLLNHCYSCLIDGSSTRQHITTEDAVYTLLAWYEEDPDLIYSIGDPLPSEFRDCWNMVCDALAA